MKIKTLLCIALCLGTTTWAQMGIGLEAGANFSKDRVITVAQVKDTKIRNGFRAGVVLDMPLVWKFNLQPGLFYAANGYKAASDSGHEELAMNSLELPVYLTFKLNLEVGDFFVGAGPFVGLNINGDYSRSATLYHLESGRDLRIGDKATDDVKSYNMGFGINTGFQSNSGIFIRFSALKGIYNMQPKGNSNNLIKSSNYVISVGFLLYG